jgi:ferredoxin
MKIRVDDSRCEGHGRCYALAPELIEPDDIGNGHEIGDGIVPAGLEDKARKAELNCPERAVLVEEDG